MNIELLNKHGILVKENFGFFWGGAFSNWYKSPFTIDGIQYNTVEQHMMYNKALCFKDLATAELILKTLDPAKQKALGRSVKNFSDEIWDKFKIDVVFEGCFEKFTQNRNLLPILLETKDLELVEASPYDKIWGIGMGVENENITNKSKWNGQNLLGKVLSSVRDTLKDA